MLAYLVDAETAAVDYVHGGEGLLMAPAYAVPRLLDAPRPDAAGLRLLRDPRGVRRAGAGHAAGLGGPDFCRSGSAWTAARLDRPQQLNVNGSSLAVGHPFAATGGRIVATLAKLLAEKGSGRGLISICAAGGQGVVAILER